MIEHSYLLKHLMLGYRQRKRLRSMKGKLRNRRGGLPREFVWQLPLKSTWVIHFWRYVFHDKQLFMPLLFTRFTGLSYIYRFASRLTPHVCCPSFYSLIFFPQYLHSVGCPERGSIWDHRKRSRNRVQCPLRKLEHDVQRYVVSSCHFDSLTAIAGFI